MKLGIALGLAALGALGITPTLGVHMPFVSDGYQAPAQCMQWYDGCNMCQKNGDGVVTCSTRICANDGEGFCVATSTAE